MKIDIWMDFICPYCYIGKRNLEKAIEGRNDVEIELHSYELDPYSSEKTNKDIYQLVAEKYGKTYDEAKLANSVIVNMAKDVGLNYNMDLVQHTNTLKAHRLLQYAKEKNRAYELSELIYKAYFEKGKFISDIDLLNDLAVEIGLNKVESKEVLESNRFLNQVRNDESDAVELKISAVPFFLINGKYRVSGAQPPNVFEEIFDNIDKQ